MSIWAPIARRQAPTVTKRGLPKRVKDWPPDAKTDFDHVKNELWRWVKKNNIPNRTRLGLIAYEAVKGEYEREPDIICETEEDLWIKIRELMSKP